jgi:hypothetical protein
VAAEGPERAVSQAATLIPMSGIVRGFYEAPVLAIMLFREDPWLEKIGAATVFDVEVREPGTKHSISLQQVNAGSPERRRIQTRRRRRRS